MLSIFNFGKIPPIFRIAAFILIYLLLVMLIRQKVSISEDYLLTLKYAYFQYGYILVFIGALLEGNLLSGFVLPASIIVLLGAAFAREEILSLPLVVITATIGFTIAYGINYLIGQHGWHRLLVVFGLLASIEAAKEKLEKYGSKAFFIGTIFPGSAIFLSTTAGITKYSFTHFLFFIFLSQLFWTTVWCSVAYFFGLTLAEFFLKHLLLLPLILLAIVMGRKFL